MEDGERGAVTILHRLSSILALRMSSIIDISDLSFAYRDALVLKDVSLRVEAGTALGLIGPDGGGETTVIRGLVGLVGAARGGGGVGGVGPRGGGGGGGGVGGLPPGPPP